MIVEDVASVYKAKMDNKLYRIWKALLQMPERWVDVQEVACMADLTCRQVFAQIAHIPQGTILKRTNLEYQKGADGSQKVSQLYLNVPEEDIPELRAMVERRYFCISDEQVALVRNTLSSAGWQTLDDIVAQTDLRKCDVTRILSTMTDISMKYFGAVQSYKLGVETDVSEHI